MGDKDGEKESEEDWSCDEEDAEAMKKKVEKKNGKKESNLGKRKKRDEDDLQDFFHND